jgi:hypothetical protein
VKQQVLGYDGSLKISFRALHPQVEAWELTSDALSGFPGLGTVITRLEDILNIKMK